MTGRDVAVCVTLVLGISMSQRADGQPLCRGDYAEDLAMMSPRAREIERTAAPYSVAVRTIATYECVSYASDGSLKRSRLTTQASGTAFGYRYDGADTLLLTNDHVAAWPAVTDDDHVVDGVPGGCKRVSDSLAIVDNDDDAYAADDIALARVVTDPVLDVAVLRAQGKLAIMPWKVGRSAPLAVRVAVEVKGFPLGAFRATNVGKVVSSYDHDVQGDRNHDDFVVDALLTSGGSGSPVFAVSCATGELELVGIFHARYSNASALNVVVAIDQVRELMAELKRSKRPAGPVVALDTAARGRLIDELARDPNPPYFSLGPLCASISVRADGTLIYLVFGSDFPRTTAPVLAIEDRPSADPATFGMLGTVRLGTALGLRAYLAADGDAESQAQLARTLRALRALRESAAATFAYREAARTASGSRVDFDRTADRRRVLDKTLWTQRDAARAATDLATRELAKATGPTIGADELLRPLALTSGAAPSAGRDRHVPDRP